MSQTPTTTCGTVHKAEPPQPVQSPPRLAYPRLVPLLVLAAAYRLNVAGYMVKSDCGNGFDRLVTLLEHYWQAVELP